MTNAPFIIQPSNGVIPPFDWDLTEKIRTRKLSYLNGFELLIQYLSLSNTQRTLLREWVMVQRHAIQSVQKYLSTAKKAERDFYSYFFDPAVKVLSHVTGLSVCKCQRMLAEAERYAVWKMPRLPVETSVLLQEARKTLHVTMQEESIYALSDEQKAEWLRIFDADREPKWFLELPIWQRRYLRETLATYLNQALASFESIPALWLSDGQTLDIEAYRSIFSQIPPRWFLDLSDECQHQLKTLLDSYLGCPPAILRCIPGLANFGLHRLWIDEELISQKPRFSIPVPGDVKDFQEKVRITKENIRQLLSIPNSPLVLAIERLIYDWHIPSDQHELEVPFLLQTLISPLHKWVSPEVGLYKALEAALRDLSNMTVSVQIEGCVYSVRLSVIAPNYPVNWMRRLMTSWLPWFSFTSIGKEMIAQRRHNQREATCLLHAVGRFFSQINVHLGLSESLIKELLNLSSILDYDLHHIDLLSNKILSHIADGHQKTKIMQLLRALRDYVELYQRQPSRLERVGHFFTRGAHKEKFMMSLEQMITETIGGIASGFCKSGKERKAAEVLHTDAMSIYYRLFRQFPKYLGSREDRQTFVTIFSGLNNIGHHQAFAERNAPGVFALKDIQLLRVPFLNLFNPWPTDILKRVLPTREDDARREFLSNLNKPRKPSLILRLKMSRDSKTGFQDSSMFPALMRDVSSSATIIGALTRSESSQALFERSLSTISAGQFSTEMLSSEPVSPVQWGKADVDRLSAQAVYFPKGSSDFYETNTMELKGSEVAQMELLPGSALKYWIKNSDAPLVLTGSNRMIETLQWILIAGLYISPHDICLPVSTKPIKVIRNKKGDIKIPSRYRQLVQMTKRLKKEYDHDPVKFSPEIVPKKQEVVAQDPCYSLSLRA